jgi:CubicO group peptidase (beta-lactamase class C family)
MMLLRRKLFHLFLAASFCSFAADNPASKAGLDAERLARIPKRMNEFVQSHYLAGIVTLVARHGVVAELDAVGWQDVERKRPMAKDSIFQVMSMTKPVTGIGIMLLYEEGKLGIGDRVDKFLPEFANPMVLDGQNPDGTPKLKKGRPITIRDLMTHTAGVWDGSADELMDITDQMRMPLADAVKLYAQKPLYSDRDTKWKYSSPGISILGRIIEVVSGMPYERFIGERLFQPLGMKDSFYFPPESKQDRIAMVYHKPRGGGELQRSTEHLLGGDPAAFRKGARYPAPGWGLYSTASDLVRLYQMLLNGGTLDGKRYLARPTVDLMTQAYTAHLPNLAILRGTGWGLTFEVISNPNGNFLMYSPGTFGHGGAFGTAGWIDPKKDMIRIFLVQDSEGEAGAANSAFMVMAAASIAK